MNSRRTGRAKPKPPDAFLSEREEQVARCLATGLRNKEIAATLFITENTVKKHVHRIFKKTGVKDRLEVGLWMISQEQARVTERSSSKIPVKSDLSRSGRRKT
jgi:DNA-binding NarL/FixJ family response regulator